MTALPPLSDLKTMRGSVVIETAKEVLREIAERRRQVQENLENLGLEAWDDSVVCEHAVLCAVSEALDRWLADARRAEAKAKAPGEQKRKPHYLVLETADILRSQMIIEVTRLAPKAAAEPAETETAA
jgi:hypothetical protein